MSAIAGIFYFHGAPIPPGQIERMTDAMKARGPDEQTHWVSGAIALGHCMLRTTPEALEEQQPLISPDGNLVMVWDGRLDNRSELTHLLTSRGIVMRNASDGEMALQAYWLWGEETPKKLLGDFTFAVWDASRQTVFCARDHMGMRPFYYHHDVGHFFAFASTPTAILTLPNAPLRINEARIADFLVDVTEGIDKSCTFYEGIHRLPPAHCLAVSPHRAILKRYWSLKRVPELKLESDKAYEEAFLAVFTEAVHCRLRCLGSPGAMLSGGMDSSSVVAVAARLLAQQGRAPLPTFSAVAPAGVDCIETRTIREAQQLPGIQPHEISYDALAQLEPALTYLTLLLEEPFDYHMTLPRAVYLLAHRHGCRVVLDGVAGDIALSEGHHLARLLRGGHWRAAWREARGHNRFWGTRTLPLPELLHAARKAFVPHKLLLLARWMERSRRQQRQLQYYVDSSRIRPDFAHRIELGTRLQTLARHSSPAPLSTFGAEHLASIDHPNLTVARERYERTAAPLAIEPRDPFMDRRVLEFCLSLPHSQRMAGGWPKSILRRAMDRLLPDAVRWRRGKQHLGWDFTRSLLEPQAARLAQHEPAEYLALLAPFITADAASALPGASAGSQDPAAVERCYKQLQLGLWLKRQPRIATPQQADPLSMKSTG